MSENVICILDEKMEEPYLGYTADRSRKIGHVLSGIMPGESIAVCSRPVEREELPHPSTVVCGVVIKDSSHLTFAYKDAIYNRLNTPGDVDISGSGIATKDIKRLIEYFNDQVSLGNTVLLKEPRKSNSEGQIEVKTLTELRAAFNILSDYGQNVVVAMPKLKEIFSRTHVSCLNLGRYGSYVALGQELTTYNGDVECYGGTILAVCYDGDDIARDRAIDVLELDPRVVSLGQKAIREYEKHVDSVGIISFDGLVGKTANGKDFCSIIDMSPRVGGATPAVVLGVEALRARGSCNYRIAFASVKLDYAPLPGRYKPGETVFLDSEELRITAKVKGVE